MKYSSPELVLDAKAVLGEGPSWDARTGRLYWVNLRDGQLRAYCPDTNEDQIHSIGQLIGCVAPMRSGKLLLGLKEGLATFDLSSAELNFLQRPEAHLPGNRFNDGKCGPDGRFLAGTMDDAEKETTGSLYSLSPDGTLQKLLTGVAISNGLAWSPDHHTFYFIDTPTRQVKAFDYDLATGGIANPRVAVEVPETLGWPDGMTSDTEGRLWVAMWGGAAVTVWDPKAGSLLERIPIPAKNVSSCVFGGKDLNELYITSARVRLEESDLKAYPLTGGLFRLQTDVTGLPTFVFQD